MLRRWFASLALVAMTMVALGGAPLAAQERLPDPPAATVNGEAIPEVMVRRALKNVPPEHVAKARTEIIEFLIANVLIDQHVKPLVKLTDQELADRMKLVKDETQRMGKTFEQLLKELELTEAEMQQQVAADMRWEKFVAGQITEAQTQDYFDKHKDWFDGSQVSARHLLVAVPAGADEAKKQQLQRKIAELRALIAKRTEAGMAQVDAKLDPLAKEQARQRLQLEAFMEVAAKESDCPSKANGGDLGSFTRIGGMVEPFAAAAFALKPGQLSEVVTTQYGYHVILCTGRTTGQPITFEMAKEQVKDVLADQLRDKLVAELKAKAKIQITK